MTEIKSTMSEFIDVKDAAEMIGMSARYVYDRIDDGSIKAIRFGRRVKIKRVELERYKKMCELESSVD